MILTNPIWLFALAAIGIPVIIHLWNIRPGKILKVGSIALFSESSPKSSRSFKLMDVLLLMLRCLLLMLLALLLTAPLWQQSLTAGKAKGWILIPQVNLLQTYKHFQPKIDSLTKAGYEFHYLGADFKKDNLTELVKTYPDSIALQDSLNYWSLTQQLSHKIPASLPVELFTTNSIYHFTGDKPQTNLHINWHTYTPADSVHTWLANAWLTTNGNIRVVQGTSNPSGTHYQYTDIKNGGQNSAYQVSIVNGVPQVSLNTSKVMVDTSTTHIAIYADKNIIDANYLNAALTAIAQLNQHKTIITRYSQAETIPDGQDWIFWLSEKIIDAKIIQQSKNVFNYESGKIATTDTWIKNTESYTELQAKVTIPLYKTIASKPNNDTPLWADGFGNAILSLSPGKTNTYHFYNRFNPAWNDLVWDDNFPKWLLGLMEQSQYKFTAHERRAINADQLKSEPVAVAEQVVDQHTKLIDLTKYLFIALVLVFFAERWLATKQKTTLTNG
jgi:hypothetical protein